jgi:7,8-dihydropterin-6-yl-methyl-4-(beta-D-ribofuranosyl)aminobenzene 5'-phosphate synthase
MEYTEKVIEHFSNPRNVGEIPDADGVGAVGSPECGDMLKVWIKIGNERLIDIKYKVFGCPAAIAACSMMTELAMGRHIDDARRLTDAQIAEALGGLPDNKYHCSNLAASALHEAITDYICKNPARNSEVSITTLVNDTASEGLACEHGLSFLIQYAGRQILFDTGQSNIILENARLLGINLAETEAIILSHGHYDHTGGLSAVLAVAPQAAVYVHPAALNPKFSRNNSRVRAIGMLDSAKEAITNKAGSGKVLWTEAQTEVSPGLFVTGQIPRTTDFEDVGGRFFIDRDCREADVLPDDQAVFFKSANGLVVLLGCAHSGTVNTLNYVAGLSGAESIYIVMGGMHLLNASLERIKRTIEAFRRYNVRKIGLAHCTGNNPIEQFEKALVDRCSRCSVGMRMHLSGYRSL